jgi:hypothetical protein
MKILVIEQIFLWNDSQRENWKRFWNKELHVLHPKGINRKQLFFMYIFFHSVYSQRIFYYCHKVKDLCSPPLINDNLLHSQMRHTLSPDYLVSCNYTI